MIRAVPDCNVVVTAALSEGQCAHGRHRPPPRGGRGEGRSFGQRLPGHGANKHLILLRLRELSSRSEQERLWPRHSEQGRDMSSFVEAVCGLFDDSGFTDFIQEKRQTGLGLAAEQALLELGAVTDKIDWKMNEQALIDSKEMDTVRHLTAVALKLIEST